MARTGHLRAPEPFPPPLKVSLYGAGIATYTLIAGLCGALQILIGLIDVAASVDRGLLTALRVIVVAGAAAGSALLIYELHTPHRFYNMVRIIRMTSPMSFGAYVLIAFTGLAALSAASALIGWQSAARVFGWAAAVPGVVMAFYSATLLSATSTPFWAAYPRSLAVRYAASSMAGASAMVVLVAAILGSAPVPLAGLAVIGAFALVVDLLVTLASQHRAPGPGWGTGLAALLDTLGARFAGALLPLALGAAAVLTPAWTQPAAVMAASLVVTGAFLMRWAVILRGNETARSPENALRLTGTPEADLPLLRRGSGQW